MEKLRPVVFGPDRLPGFETGDPNQPAVILLQEWWGVTPIVKQQAALLSERGPFRVLVPDLYKGVVGVDMEEAGHLMTGLDFRRAVRELQQAVDYLRATGSPRVAISGGCMGGALSFAAAQYVNGLAAAAPFYGTPAREMPWIEVDKIRIPVQYHTGMLDPILGFSDPRNAVEVTDKMRAAGGDVELHLYDNTPHSFLNALTPEGAEFLRRWRYGVPPPEQVTLAFDRLVHFLNRHLRAP
ncbi:hypothetical protein PLESTB_001033000 [Pleodorina starrii]|uniref:Dienelactone hydrolase domain-containing protein n=1 Tax=Pleodorina starrii TaxID=330485 RepID=A0A9W6BPY7_9CHLO|nr:hypothetical protein PLESTM_001825000 [Pleodorina starrii]GLC55825.1 hypothetical protein PLESTB_001033000 [Pleodorina starrii]GLC63811.1 hypothetical protein PLESTF_000085600 [Pleodorina starrii]